MARKKSLPGWFPFAVVASGLVAIAAGIKSNWGRATAANEPPAPPPNPPPTPPPPPPQQAGVLQEWFGT